MTYEENQIYHIYNQGNNREPIFFQERNYLFFLQKMRKHLLPFADILCYCLMPNHFHLLVIPKTVGCELSDHLKPNHRWEDQEGKSERMTLSHPFTKQPENFQQNLSKEIAILRRSYTRAINKQENRTGSLFRAKTKVKNGWIEDFLALDSKHKNLLFRQDNDYALACFHYIHNNPVEANLVLRAADWIYSSAKDYAGLRNGTMCNRELAKRLLFN